MGLDVKWFYRLYIAINLKDIKQIMILDMKILWVLTMELFVLVIGAQFWKVQTLLTINSVWYRTKLIDNLICAFWNVRVVDLLFVKWL